MNHSSIDHSNMDHSSMDHSEMNHDEHAPMMERQRTDSETKVGDDVDSAASSVEATHEHHH